MERDKHLDFVSGILILWMIVIHVRAATGFEFNTRYIPFLFCFMAWFFFKSGMYHRQRTNSTIIRSGWKRLLIPYCIFSIIGVIIEDILLVMNGETNVLYCSARQIWQIAKLGGVGWNLPIWFLLSLFIIKVAFNYLMKKIKVSIICMLAFILAFAINFYSIEYPCYLGNVYVGMCFYSLGFVFKDIQYKRWILYTSIVIYIITFALIPSFVDVRANICSNGNYMVFYVSALSSIIILNNISKIFEPYFPVIRKIGMNSMSYYLSHWIVMSLGLSFLKRYYPDVNSSISFLAIMILMSLTLPLIDYILHKDKIKFIIGE